MKKSIDITIDIAVARKMLQVAGFSYSELSRATDDEIFKITLSMIECYGVTFDTNTEH